MQITKFIIKDLFHRFDYDIPLLGPQTRQPALPAEQQPIGPTVTILHGENGVGKTTILRMMNGFLKLDFNIFRAVPFSYCELAFNTGDSITVMPEGREGPRPLTVSFRDLTARLDPIVPGAYEDTDRPDVERFRNTFLEATDSISFSLIDADRVLERPRSDEHLGQVLHRYDLSTEEFERIVARPIPRGMQGRVITRPISRKRREQEEDTDVLATRVKDFVNNAQIDYASFFATKEPDLFSRILRQLAEPRGPHLEPKDLLNRLSRIRDWDNQNARLGLGTDRWDYNQLADILSNPEVGRDALTVISSYVEMLESRHADRAQIAQRLLRFESLMAQFYSGIHLSVDAKHGFLIKTESGRLLHEDQLSSGEYHLLYLMVSALTTRRRGTVLAIDEPELSMHIGWQRRLIRTLIDCASGAEPQFIFATHSPDLAANFQDSMIRLGPIQENGPA